MNTTPGSRLLALMDAARQRNHHRGETMTDTTDTVPVERALIDEWLRDEPMIVSGIRRDMERTPGGRGGELRHTPATPGVGAGGCPADALVDWVDRLAALADGAES